MRKILTFYIFGTEIILWSWSVPYRCTLSLLLCCKLYNNQLFAILAGLVFSRLLAHFGRIFFYYTGGNKYLRNDSKVQFRSIMEQTKKSCLIWRCWECSNFLENILYYKLLLNLIQSNIWRIVYKTWYFIILTVLDVSLRMFI